MRVKMVISIKTNYYPAHVHKSGNYMKKLYFLLVFLVSTCMAMEQPTSCITRDLIRQFNNIYQPLTKLNLASVSADDISDLQRQLKRAAVLLNQISLRIMSFDPDEAEPADPIDIGDVVSLGYKFTGEVEQQNWQEFPQILLVNWVLVLHKRIIALNRKLDTLKKTLNGEESALPNVGFERLFSAGTDLVAYTGQQQTTFTPSAYESQVPDNIYPKTTSIPDKKSFLAYDLALAGSMGLFIWFCTSECLGA